MERNAFFDNAKVLLIFLVVFGHLIQPFASESLGIHTIYMWIYTFHMPAFIFLSGFFAKGSGNKKYIWNLAKKLLLPYLIFQMVYSGYYFFIGKSGLEFKIFHPQWALWFLFSLFCWHILLTVFKKIPASVGLLLTIAIGVGIGYFAEIGAEFSLSRTFAFFPFFLAGYWMNEERLSFLKLKSTKVLAVGVMAFVAVFMYMFPDLNSDWFLASKSYETLGYPVMGGLLRVGVYTLAVVMSISVFTFVPSTHNLFTSLGARTLYVYLLHGFFIQYFREADLFYVNDFVDLIGLGLIAFGIVIFLSSKPIMRLGQPLVEGRFTKLRDFFKSRAHTMNTTS